jgi:S-adenosylmethionine:tRNA ribosyltransferase-isomerase
LQFCYYTDYETTPSVFQYQNIIFTNKTAVYDYFLNTICQKQQKHYFCRKITIFNKTIVVLTVKDIKIQDYTYVLPDERIAKFPLQERDASKLLIYKKGDISESNYRHIAAHIPADSCIFFNNTKVIPARLLFQRAMGGVIEVFCLEPTTELASSMTQQGNAEWTCIVGNAKKWKEGEILSLNTVERSEIPNTCGKGGIELKATIIERNRERFIIQFTWQPMTYTFSEILALIGQVPLPPYLHRSAEASDKERYQTIYAHFEGSVAAPTAGLHFTDNIFDEFKQKHIEPHYVTLHVGAGTFKPVKSEVIGDHDMHAEYFDVNLQTLKILRGCFGKKNIIAVGTTILRTLESLYLMGCKLYLNPQLTLEEATIKQWDAYNTAFEAITPEVAFEALMHWLESQNMERIVAKTQLLIAPPYRIRTINALVTNFHQPQSTLLLLVAAFVGDDWQRLYDYALAHDFRFLSYGDGCLLMRDLDE